MPLFSPRRPLATFVLVATAFSVPAARADVPRVVVDIPPVHSLVSRVMGDLGEPRFAMRPGVSPHGYAMRPSDAQALESSDMVFWVGETLTPWLARELSVLAPDSVSVELMALGSTLRLAPRRDARFGDDGHDHASGENASDDLAGDDHPNDEHDVDHEHGDAPYDPHGWLDPANASAWLAAIADALATADPANEARYRENAETARVEITQLLFRLDQRLSGVRERPFVVFHDSFHYLENRFDLNAVGALSPDDASDPSPARAQALRTAIEEFDVRCAFAEPPFDPDRLTALADGLELRTGMLDPLGGSLEPGPDLYEELLENVVEGLIGCLDA